MEPNNNTALAVQTPRPAVGLIEPDATKAWATVFFKSGLFSAEGNPEVQVAQAQVKILAGMEMGLQPFFAVQNLYVVKGHVFVSAAAFGALVNGPDPDGICRSKFITRKSTTDEAVIEFYRRGSKADQWELVHTQTYRWEDVPVARRNNPTYTTDRADMLWNRAMTKGARKSCPEKVGGMRSVEEVREEAEWEPVENGGNGHGNGHDSLIPEDVQAPPNVAAIPAAPSEEAPATVAGTKDPIAEPEKPKRARRKPEAPVQPPAEPPQPDSVTDGAFESSDAEQPAADDPSLDEKITADQAQQFGDWVLTHKFDGGPAAIAAAGLPKPADNNLRNLTQRHFLVLKAAHEEYLARADEEFGWNRHPGAPLTEAQVKQLQDRAERARRRG